MKKQVQSWLEAETHKKLRIALAEDGQTFAGWLNEQITTYLQNRKPVEPPPPPRIPRCPECGAPATRLDAYLGVGWCTEHYDVEMEKPPGERGHHPK